MVGYWYLLFMGRVMLVNYQRILSNEYRLNIPVWLHKDFSLIRLNLINHLHCFIIDYYLCFSHCYSVNYAHKMFELKILSIISHNLPNISHQDVPKTIKNS
jgi:hypothetical protein